MSDIPCRKYKLNRKLVVKADEYVGDKSIRKCIHATLEPAARYMAIVIGLNPSVANADRSDRTFTKVGRFLAQYDVKEFYMLNLYETVSSDPKDIDSNDITNWQEHRNLFEKADYIIVAWGTDQVHLDVKKRTNSFLGQYRRKVFCVQDADQKKGVHPRRYSYDNELVYYFDNPLYPVITLCGSTRFKDDFYKVQKRLTLEGYIVISVGLFGHSGDQEVWENMDEGALTRTKEMLDDMHKRKIDMADGIYVINVGGYIGESTKSEIQYAEEHGKRVEYLENVSV